MTPLARHQARSLAQLARIRAGFVVLGLFGWLFTAGTTGSFWMIPILISTTLIVLGIAVALERGYSPDVIGTVSAIVDGLILAALPVLFYWAEPDAPTAFLLKNDEALFGLVACALQAYTMRPSYPILVGALYGFAHVVLFAWAFETGEVTFTASWVEARTTDSVHLAGLLFNHLAIVPAASVLMSLVAWSGSRLIDEAVEHERRTNLLSRYFSPKVAATIAQSDHLERGGSERQVAVLFMDLVGFTSLSESLTPAQTLALLTEVHDVMVRAVFEHDGSLDKFLGDGLMATFGTLEGETDRGPRAVRAALAMQDGLAGVNSARAQRGESPLAMRIGIHLGPAIVGNVGSRNRLEFTAIGDTVNTASRIESACKELDEELLFSREVAETLHTSIRTCGHIRLRGKTDPLELFSLEHNHAT